MAGPLKEVDVNEFGSQQLTSETEVVHLLTPSNLVWRRDVPIDSSALVAANETKGTLDFSATSTTIPLEGEWVKLDETTGEATLSAEGEWGMLVWAGRHRLDVPGANGITVLAGQNYVVETTNYDAAQTYTWGDRLYINAAGTTNYVSNNAPAGTPHIVGIYEGTVARKGVNYLRFRSV